MSVQAYRSELHIGPLPSPDTLIRYNQAVPDAAERIPALAERQAAHRQQMEKRSVESELGRAWYGLVCALIAALAVLGAATYFASIGQAWVAGVLGGPDIVALVTSFVYGTERRRSERIERAKLMSGRRDQ
jgi:uncharacterized membrane protein